MAIALTLASVGGTVLTEGIKFLYGQASELITWWRQRNQDKEIAAPVAPPHSASAPDSFDGPVLQGQPDLDALARLEEQLAAVLKQQVLVGVGALGETLETTNAEHVRAAETLRSLLESVYGQAITFHGEAGRPPSGTPFVRGTAKAESVLGRLTGLDAEVITEGHAEGSADVVVVEPGGEVTGLKVKQIGRHNP